VLVDHFLDTFRIKYRRQRPSMTRAQMGRLLAHRWPGNVRELRNVVENFVLAGPGAEIELESPPDRQDWQLGFGDLLARPYKLAVGILLQRFQLASVRAADLACGDDEHAVAELMGLTLPGLRKIRKRLAGRLPMARDSDHAGTAIASPASREPVFLDPEEPAAR
jgi:DNA-binding NtrC family response regulator